MFVVNIYRPCSSLIQALDYWLHHRDDMVIIVSFSYFLLWLPRYSVFQLWQYIATFRNRCKAKAVIIARQRYGGEIFPKPEDFQGDAGLGQEEYHAKTSENVAKLLKEWRFHQDGKDAKVSCSLYLPQSLIIL
jgi:hypothetical protein